MIKIRDKISKETWIVQEPEDFKSKDYKSDHYIVPIKSRFPGKYRAEDFATLGGALTWINEQIMLKRAGQNAAKPRSFWD